MLKNCWIMWGICSQNREGRSSIDGSLRDGIVVKTLRSGLFAMTMTCLALKAAFSTVTVQVSQDDLAEAIPGHGGIARYGAAHPW